MNTRKTSRLLTLCSLLAAILLASCQAGTEIHYLKEGENFYRLKIKECAFLSSSRYMSGYYDEHAVDVYFGEITRPDSAKLAGPKPNKTELVDPNTGELCTMEDRKLVLLLSTNADVVATEIGNLAENEQTLELMARLANRDKLEQNQALRQEVQSAVSNNQAVVHQGDGLLANLDPNDNAASEQRLLAFLSYLGSQSGRTEPFGSLEAARAWFMNQPTP